MQCIAANLVANFAKGHSRPNWTIRAMSAFLPLATELLTLLEVRFVPLSDIDQPRRGLGEAPR
jgi:hypothetical protein